MIALISHYTFMLKKMKVYMEDDPSSQRVTLKNKLFPHLFLMTKLFSMVEKFELNNDLCYVSLAKNSCLSCCLILGDPCL